MITLEGETLVLDRSQEGDDILPLVHPAKGRQAGGWFIDIGIDEQDVLFMLIDAELLDEDLPIRYIARDGQQSDGIAHIEELISGPDGNICRLRGVGAPLTALLADDPKKV